MSDLEVYAPILNKLKAEFEENQVKERPGGSNKVFYYIPTEYVTNRLDEVFPLRWSWEVLKAENIVVDKVRKDYKTKETTVTPIPQVIILGRLTLHFADGHSVFRDGYGGAELDKGNVPGDNYKIADSNAFKKAAYKFGIGQYLGLEGLEDQQSAPPKQQYNNSKPAYQAQSNNFKPQTAPASNSKPKADNPFLKNNR